MLIAKKDRKDEALEVEESVCSDIFGTVSTPLSQSSTEESLEGVSNDLLKEVKG
jgi:hypothetical protein